MSIEEQLEEILQNESQKDNKRFVLYNRKKINKQKLKKSAYKGRAPIYYDENKNRYVKCNLSERKKFIKKASSKKIRTDFSFPLKGNGYRKVYDYWWILD